MNTNTDKPVEEEPTVVVHDIIVQPSRDEANPYILGVVVFGALIIGLLGVLAVVLNNPMALFSLAVASGAAYLNYTFLHALRGGYAAWLGYTWLVRLATLSGVVSVTLVVSVAYNLYILGA